MTRLRWPDYGDSAGITVGITVDYGDSALNSITPPLYLYQTPAQTPSNPLHPLQTHDEERAGIEPANLQNHHHRRSSGLHRIVRLLVHPAIDREPRHHRRFRR